MCHMRNTLAILSSMPVAAFKTGVETLFYLILLFYLKISFVLCKNSNTEPYNHKVF